jgi:hypothetical protein
MLFAALPFVPFGFVILLIAITAALHSALTYLAATTDEPQTGTTSASAGTQALAGALRRTKAPRNTRKSAGTSRRGAKALSKPRNNRAAVRRTKKGAAK